MFWVFWILAAFIALFPKKFMFFIRVSYTLFFHPLFIIFVSHWTTSDTQSHWTAHCTWACRIILVEKEGSVEPVREKKSLLVGNHRNIADFFLHDQLTKCTANFISRALVAIAFPVMAFISWYENRCWYFIRGSTKNRIEEFYKWLDMKFAMKNSRKALVVYPEGHRNLQNKPLPLKTGMLRYAYSRGIPVQMFMCSGYDQSLNGKNCSAVWGRSYAEYKIYPPLDPKEFHSEAEYVSELTRLFSERFYDFFPKAK